LPCISGITGADMSKRIRSIMLHRFTDLGMGKKLLLAALALGTVAGPVAFGLMQNAPQASQILHATGPAPSFEVASIKPNHSESGFAAIRVPGLAAPKDRFIAANTTIKGLMRWAWAPGLSRPLPEDQVVGGPGWINSDRYDIEAKLDDLQVAAMEKLAPLDRSVQVKLMVQSLLADRFKLVVNDSMTVPRPVYALAVTESGSKLKETAPCNMPPMPPPPPPPPGTQRPANMPQAGRMVLRPGEMIACAISTSDLARDLQFELGRPVLDRTGLTGKYNFDLKWTPDVTPGAMPGPPTAAEMAPPDTSGPSIFTAIQEQLGLKLESTKAPVETLEIVHIEKPSEN
jgi:bla regulator protein blaR1